MRSLAPSKRNDRRHPFLGRYSDPRLDGGECEQVCIWPEGCHVSHPAAPMDPTVCAGSGDSLYGKRSKWQRTTCVGWEFHFTSKRAGGTNGQTHRAIECASRNYLG